MAPIILPANQLPRRFYRGGPRISAFRSSSPSGPYEPEDWVASTTCCHGQGELGLTKLKNGTLLVDAIRNEPGQWFCPEHIKAFGSDTKILVKLLDAGQRLPVHAHPHRDWARAHLGSVNGKAELWFVLEPGTVWLGLREEISHEHLLHLTTSQAAEELLGMMHKVRLERGQAMYVPPGVLHAIGEGLLVAEVQEPSDLSVLCEWRDFAIDGTKEGHLQLGFDVALTAVERKARSKEDIKALMTGPDTEGFVGSPLAKEYFRAERFSIRSEQSFAEGFAILIVFSGEMELRTTTGFSASLHSGMTLVMPYADGAFTLNGEGDIFMARPPQPQRSKT